VRCGRGPVFGFLTEFRVSTVFFPDPECHPVDIAQLFTVENLIALLTLASLEIVLGIDNIVFIAILAGKLVPEKRDRARRIGILLSVVTRIGLLMTIGWIVHLKEPLFNFFGHGASGKDLVMIFGGLFLLGKATYEIHHRVQGHAQSHGTEGRGTALGLVLVQIVLIDIVFSLDSVITAVGMTDKLPVMITAVMMAVAVMLAFSGPIVRFIERNPAIKLLALSFLLLIGVLLVAEGFHQKIDKGYIYFAMAFSLGVELLQMRSERRPSDLEA
jgi:predicted tellurium resistance membrane protein TerC